MRNPPFVVYLLTTVFALAMPWGNTLNAASHREAPAIALDPTADITDFYAFRSWENPDNLVFIMNFIPAQEPSSGPNYFNFDDTISSRRRALAPYLAAAGTTNSCRSSDFKGA